MAKLDARMGGRDREAERNEAKTKRGRERENKKKREKKGRKSNCSSLRTGGIRRGGESRSKKKMLRTQESEAQTDQCERQGRKWAWHGELVGHVASENWMTLVAFFLTFGLGKPEAAGRPWLGREGGKTNHAGGALPCLQSPGALLARVSSSFAPSLQKTCWFDEKMRRSCRLSSAYGLIYSEQLRS